MNDETRMPGTGKQTSEWCGQIRAFAVCPVDEGHVRIPIRGNTCGDPGCPICWPVWAMRGADRIGDSVQGLRDAGMAIRRPLPWPNHVVWSVPVEEDDAEALWVTGYAKEIRAELLKAFYKIAASVGSYAGVAIVHLLRLKDGYRAVVKQRSQELGVPYWEALKTFPDWRDMVRLSPHIHSISFGHLVPSDDVHSETGWIYKNKGPLRTRDDVERVAYYALSHCLLVPGTLASLRYGLMQSKKLRIVERGRLTIPCTCPVCGSALVKSYLVFDGLTRETDDEVTRTRTKNRYELLLGSGPPR